MKQRTDPLNPRAVLGPLKAWPGNTGAKGKPSATASLDGALRAQHLKIFSYPQAGPADYSIFCAAI